MAVAPKVSVVSPRDPAIAARASVSSRHYSWAHYSRRSGSPACATAPCSMNGSRKYSCRNCPKAQSLSLITPASTNPNDSGYSPKPTVLPSYSCRHIHPKITSSNTHGSPSKTPPEKSSKPSTTSHPPSKPLSCCMTSLSVRAIAVLISVSPCQI